MGRSAPRIVVGAQIEGHMMKNNLTSPKPRGAGVLVADIATRRIIVGLVKSLLSEAMGEYGAESS
jgi:hypothetical protein